MRTPGNEERRLLSIVTEERLRRVLKVMLDENEFFSPFGIRALSRAHLEKPYMLEIGGQVHKVDYEPGESTTACLAATRTGAVRSGSLSTSSWSSPFNVFTTTWGTTSPWSARPAQASR